MGALDRPVGEATTQPAFLRATNTDVPMLVPFEELRPRAEPQARVQREEGDEPPPLPFSGFSLLALVLSGLAATSAGRRLHVATAPPRPEAPVLKAPVLKAPVLKAPVLKAPVQEARPAPDAGRDSHRPLLLAVGLLALAALAAARAR